MSNLFMLDDWVLYVFTIDAEGFDIWLLQGTFGGYHQRCLGIRKMNLYAFKKWAEPP